MDTNTYIDDYIDFGNEEVISLRNFYDTILVGDKNNELHIFRTAISDFFLNHYNELSDIIELYALPERFYYKPKMLAEELYGTTELWLALLRANDMKNITEFHLPIIRVYSPEPLKEMIEVYFKREDKM